MNPKATLVRTPRDEEDEVDGARATDPVTIVILGASGDLTLSKLLPALCHLQADGFLPEQYTVIGCARSEMSDQAWREVISERLRGEVRDPEKLRAAAPLIRALHYVPGNFDDPHAFGRLKQRIEQIEQERMLPGNRLFYLAVGPEFFGPLIERLHEAGLFTRPNDATWTRVIIEKPFGRDLQSARALNAVVTRVLGEEQIYRIDHYLGKETVQNLMAVRFANTIFEPLFNRRYVDNVQITVSETAGMEGRRGGYYDQEGALRDMVENHMLQLLSLITMEPPVAIDAGCIRDEKVKLVRAIETISRAEVAQRTARGQYGVGEDSEGRLVRAYREEERVDPRSNTETFVALRLGIDNWRWAGVPFLLRTGKRLRKRVTQIAMQFKMPPLQMFRELGCSDAKSNVLIFRIQPDEGISLSFASKVPGMKLTLEDVRMDFFYARAFTQRSPEAYERLLLDALRGDPSLFTRSDEVDFHWRAITPILEGWAAMPPPHFPNYYPFTDGPEEAEHVASAVGVQWRPLDEM
jgi:glucose-6-phosphate 1-dehydrogenase